MCENCLLHLLSVNIVGVTKVFQTQSSSYVHFTILNIKRHQIRINATESILGRTDGWIRRYNFNMRHSCEERLTARFTN
jgi:hypothetical protein